MTRADEVDAVTEGVCIWQAYDANVKCDLTSAALRIGESLVLVDPIALSAAGAQDLESYGRPALVVCTSGNHARAADHFRRHYRIPIAGHAEAESESGLSFDTTITEGTRLLEAIEVCTLPGAAAGEIALATPDGVVCVGDALIHLPPEGLRILPDKYCADPKELRTSLRKLLRWDFRVLTFAHGWPLAVSARERVASLIA